MAARAGPRPARRFACSPRGPSSTEPAIPIAFPMAASCGPSRARSGAVVCAYRDEDLDRRGVSCSITEDGGRSWRFIGQLYAAPQESEHRPGDVCGYPDLIGLGGDLVGAVLHTYPSVDGVELQW